MHLDTPLQEPVSDGLVYFLALKMAAANVKGKQKSQCIVVDLASLKLNSSCVE